MRLGKLMKRPRPREVFVRKPIDIATSYGSRRRALKLVSCAGVISFAERTSSSFNLTLDGDDLQAVKGVLGARGDLDSFLLKSLEP